jgi:hypothetical protein
VTGSGFYLGTVTAERDGARPRQVVRAPLTGEEQQRRAAALAAASTPVQIDQSARDSREIVFDEDPSPPDGRTPQQQKNCEALAGDGGLPSWERVLRNAAPENRPAVLRNALIELYPLAESAAVSRVDIVEWATHQNELYRIAEPEKLQEIMVRAKADSGKQSALESASPRAADRLRPQDLKEFLELSIKPREMLLAPILPEKGLAMLYAARGTGKTHVALGIAFAVATGTKFLKWSAPTSRRVLLIDGEMPAAALQERFASIVASAPEAELDPQNIKILAGDLVEAGGIGNLASPDVQAEIDRWLDCVDLLVLDNLSSLTAVIRDNDAESWGPIQEWLLKLRRRGISVLIVHHAGKGGQQRGTSRREDVLDTSISLRHPADYSPVEGARFEVHLEKARGVHGDDARPFEAKLDVREGRAIWATRELEDANRARVQALLDDGLSVRDIADETGISKSTVQRIKKAIEAAGGNNAA